VPLIITKEMERSLAHITKAQRFKRCEVVGGDEMTRVEWQQAAGNFLELRKAYAMHLYVLRRRERCFAVFIIYIYDSNTILYTADEFTYCQFIYKVEEVKCDTFFFSSKMDRSRRAGLRNDLRFSFFRKSRETNVKN